MAVGLDLDELKIARILELNGLERCAAILAVVMVTRAHARPEAELVEIVRQYPGLESPQEAKRAVEALKSRGWLISTISYGSQLTQQAPDLRSQIAEKIGDPLIADRLLDMRASLEPFVSVIGPMSDERVYATFMDLLRNAQQEICLPMLATQPYPDTVAILEDRAKAGVRVRILLGDPALVARWRGEPMRKVAEQRIEEWLCKFRKLRTVQIRIAHSLSDLEIASCASFDRRVVRLDVYDPYAQRSLEGVMVEVVSPLGMSLNLSRVFQRVFDSAWERAYIAGRFAKPRWVLRRWWKFWLGLTLLALGFVPIPLSVWSAVMIGISVGVLAPALVDDGPAIWASILRRPAQ
jgi:hypothetical protein